MAQVNFLQRDLRDPHRVERRETMVPSPLQAPRYKVKFAPKTRRNLLGRIVDYCRK